MEEFIRNKGNWLVLRSLSDVFIARPDFVSRDGAAFYSEHRGLMYIGHVVPARSWLTPEELETVEEMAREVGAREIHFGFDWLERAETFPAALVWAGGRQILVKKHIKEVASW